LCCRCALDAQNAPSPTGTKSQVKQMLCGRLRRQRKKMITLDYEHWLNQLGINSKSIKPEDILSAQMLEDKTVLGLDIYQYSKKEESKQRLVPIVFDLIYKQTEEWITKYELALFTNNYNFRKNFIHTGDGGFQILNNPICGIVFLVRFFTVLNLFNNGRYIPELHDFIDDLEIRACMTKGNVFEYNNNHFGKPIIQNARILAADKLNRFTIDENINKWFNKEINGIASLQIRTSHEIEKLLGLKKDSLKDSKLFPQDNHLLIEDLPIGANAFRSITKQKIGEINIKNDTNSIYNIEIQLITEIENQDDMRTLYINIGNSNANDLKV
jgi:hypothetical protein